MSIRVVCLKHVPFEGPGAFAESVATRGATIEQHLVPRDGLPNEAGDLLIVMGGPMSVNDSDSWITDETTFIRSALLACKPVIGMCLGSQFMAKALGAHVHPGTAPEIGMTKVTLTPEAKRDPVFGSLPESFEVFEWHGEVFGLPIDCVPLAGSSITPIQAFRYGDHAYGLLFHVEMEASGIEALCRECSSDLMKAKLTAEDVKSVAAPCLPTRIGLPIG